MARWEVVDLDQAEWFIPKEIPPFKPKSLPLDWRKFLDQWLRGAPVTELGDDADDAISLIEHAFVYNLPWAMEAVRVRAQAHAPVDDPFDLDMDLLPNLGSGSAVAAVETGTLSIPAAVLIKAGFASRLGAISAVVSTGRGFRRRQGPACLACLLRHCAGLERHSHLADRKLARAVEGVHCSAWSRQRSTVDYDRVHRTGSVERWRTDAARNAPAHRRLWTEARRHLQQRLPRVAQSSLSLQSDGHWPHRGNVERCGRPDLVRIHRTE